MPLTQKQRKFVEAYAGNATEAARLAGYTGTPDSLRVMASRLLANVHISEALATRETKAVNKLIASREERQAFWTNAMRGAEESADFAGRLKASELLGKSEADFIDRTEHSGELTIRILEVPEDE